MASQSTFEVIIIGGSYAGLSAAMTLGRSLRNTLVIDSGKPCNEQTPHSHNFLTQDGKTPKEISTIGKAQVEKYISVTFCNDLAIGVEKNASGFNVKTSTGKIFHAKKLIFATGIKDILPKVSGFKECWGISIIHCPYCHGYEARHKKTGILANGDAALHYAKLISNLTNELILFTNGKPTLSLEQIKQIKSHNISIVETEIDEIQQHNGQIEQVLLKDQSKVSLNALYYGPSFIQHSGIPEQLGCEMTEQGLIKVDGLQRTTVLDIYACGDNSGMRAVAVAVASGMKAGAAINFDFVNESF